MPLAIKYYRLRRGLSQKAFAELVGVDQPRICNIELGIITPNETLLARLADALGVSPAFLLLQQVEVEEHIVFADTDRRVS
jgi:transcriptional regulator with XRE-family HTH domain